MYEYSDTCKNIKPYAKLDYDRINTEAYPSNPTPPLPHHRLVSKPVLSSGLAPLCNLSHLTANWNNAL